MANARPIRKGKRKGTRGAATGGEEMARFIGWPVGMADLVDLFDGFIFICSPAYEIEFANRSLIEYTGFDPVGRKCYEVLYDRDGICPWCPNERVFRGEQVRQERQNPKDGRWYSVISMPFRTPDGAFSKIAFYRDITERKATEEKLRASEELFRRFFKKCPVALSLQDLSGIKTRLDRLGKGGKRLDPGYFLAHPEEIGECLSAIRMLNVNEAYWRLLGDSSKEHFLGHFLEIVESTPPEDHAAIISAIAAGEKTFEMETTVGKLNGSGISVLLRYQVFLENDEPFSSVIFSIEDTSLHKEAERVLKESRMTMENLARHLQTVLEKDRRRIAREIHDEIGQILTALGMDLIWMRKRIPKAQSALLKKVFSMIEYVEVASLAVRKIASDLRPDLLDNLGLVAAMGRFIEEFQERTGIVCHHTVKPERIRLDPDRSLVLYRIVQEALTNVARHADAGNVGVSLEIDERMAMLQIGDDGKGIEGDRISHTESFGLMGMRERARAFGGTFDIRGVPGKGTTLTARIPLAGKEEEP